MKKEPWCSFDELKNYLTQIDQEVLLDNVTTEDDGYKLSDIYFKESYDPSIRMQIAAIFSVLGEYVEANKVHELQWSDLSPRGDNITNRILKKFRSNG